MYVRYEDQRNDLNLSMMMDLTDWLDVCAFALHSSHFFSQTLPAVVVYNNITYDLSICIYVYIYLVIRG